jgi:transcriptional regulator with AAA-type ATPase domain
MDEHEAVQQEQSLVDSLRATLLWRDAPEDVLTTAAALMKTRHFADGDVLIRQGRQGTHLHLVRSGRVDVRVHTDEGAVVVVASLGEGECFGEMSLLTGDPASADVVAAGDVETLTLDAASFRSGVASDPVLLREFVRILSRRLTQTDAAVGAAKEKEHGLEEFLRVDDAWDGDFVGKSPAIRQLRKRIEAAAATDEPVLVRGEEGTGRELAARLVHRKSARSPALVLAVDCAQIGDTEWGDKLFGHRGVRAADSHVLSYMDVAEGGTIVLKDLEHLPLAVQDRVARFLEVQAQDPEAVRQNVRVIATIREDAQELALKGRVSAALADAFRADAIEVPPLRERKRDIQPLAEHFLRKHAERLDKPVVRLDDQALIKLVSYDYRIANDRELEQAVERSVILAEGDTVAAEEIFVGPPPPARPSGLNLLDLPGPNVRPLVALLPRIGRVLVTLLFLGLILGAFLGPSEADANPVVTLVWGLWWPVLVLSFFFAGRVWCAVCPMGFLGSLGQRWRESKRRIPAWLKKHDVHIAMAGLFVIVFVEETTGMRHSPLLTGMLLVSLLVGAVAIGLLYPRRTWCRHICPLGGMAGVCSTSSLLELRPSFDVCAAKCTGHLCFKGDEHTPGCPMFNHVMFVDSNEHCLFCMSCVQSCPNDSPQLNLRLPGRELWAGAAAGPGFGLFVLLLAGLLVAMTQIQYLEVQGTMETLALLEESRFLHVGGLIAACAALPLAARWLARRRVERKGDQRALERFDQRVAALAALVTAGFVAYQLAYVPGLAWLNATILYAGEAGGWTPWVSLTLLALLRGSVLSAGLLVTAVILWRIDVNAEEETWTERVPHRATLLGLTVGYWALLMALMLAP